jgi:NADH-quinone oxidoreductase subunit M
MAEQDLIWMSAVVFLPSVFALALIFIPRGKEEIMRWVSLCGTGLTLGASIGMFITFYNNNIEQNGIRPGIEQGRAFATLDHRLYQLDKLPEGDARLLASEDWLARYPWIPRFHIDYYMGADGISVSLVLMTTLLSFLAMIASWKIDRFVRGYCMLFLILETGMLGTFLALDFFLFYIFWEVMLLPMYFLIGIWGGPRREYAAIKFFLYTLLGSVFILIALLAFYFTDIRDFVSPRVVAEAAQQETTQNRELTAAQALATTEVHSFDLVALQRVGKAALQVLNGQPVTTSFRARQALDNIEDYKRNKAPADEIRKAEAEYQAAVNDPGLKERLKQPFFQPWFQYTMFLFLLIGFAIKVPVFPFHTWLPDAHVEAPTPISMILAGVLLKMGGYGIIRIAYPICPWAAQQLALGVATFGIINIVYGAFAAMAQSDFKKLVAYSSVSHMGYVILGIAVWSAPEHAQYWDWGMNGAMFQMIAHGVTSAGMFFLVGVIYDRAHHRRLDNFRGLYEPMPLYGGLSAVIFFAAMGLPGMCGFVGEFMVVLSTWNYNRVFAVLAALTVVITAAYILWTLQRVFMGENPQYKNYPDITVREIVCITPLVVLSVALGILPGTLLLNWMEPSVSGLVDTLARYAP